jgi:hypothetical protein
MEVAEGGQLGARGGVLFGSQSRTFILGSTSFSPLPSALVVFAPSTIATATVSLTTTGGQSQSITITIPTGTGCTLSGG